MEWIAELAGRWYPADAEACLAALMRFCGPLDAAPRDAEPARGLVAPHAGFVYSGAVAGAGYAALARDDVSLVVLFAGHLGLRDPDMLWLVDAYQTPLGSIPSATRWGRRLAPALGLRAVGAQAGPAGADNAVELHLPFIRYTFGDTPLLVVGVAPTPRARVLGQALGTALRKGGERPVFIASTDLTHYGPAYGFTPRARGSAARDWVREVHDRRFIDAVLARDPAAVLSAGRAGSACCPGAVAATLEALAAQEALAADEAPAGPESAAPRLISHILSIDVVAAPPGADEHFVGYASVAC